MPVGKEIRANQVTIEALAVTIQSLRVGRKQMTQSLFRQLPKRSIIDDETGEIMGTPWCYVNYYWGDCTKNHLHVVWEYGGKIYRDCFYATRNIKWGCFQWHAQYCKAVALRMLRT